jgi:hypothetical protein
MAEAGDLEAERDKGSTGQEMCLVCMSKEGWSHKLRCGEPKRLQGQKLFASRDREIGIRTTYDGKS